MPITPFGVGYPLGINFERSFTTDVIAGTQLFPWSYQWKVPAGYYYTLIEASANVNTSAVVRTRTALLSFLGSFSPTGGASYGAPETFPASTSKGVRFASYITAQSVTTTFDMVPVPVTFYAPQTSILFQIGNNDIGDLLDTVVARFNAYYWDGSGDSNESAELLMPVPA